MNDSDDHLVGEIVSQCLYEMRNYNTATKLTACYNMTIGILNLFTVRGEKESVLQIVNEFHQGLIDHINSIYDE